MNKIGYPDKWRDYSKLKLCAATRWATRCACTSLKSARDLAKIGKPVDKGEWG
jgi:putative endopeptidase